MDIVMHFQLEKPIKKILNLSHKNEIEIVVTIWWSL